VPVRAGDLVLLATDGLFDNVHEEEILRCVHQWTKQEGDILARAADADPETFLPVPLNADENTDESLPASDSTSSRGNASHGSSAGSRRATDML